MAPRITPKPTPVSGRNNKKSKVNKKVGLNKTTVNTTIHKKKKENKPKKDNSSGLDEKGNPLPMEDPKGGGDPVCPSGYKIDYDFDPFDPINPPFRCISALKDPDDGPISNIMNKLNNSANNITDLASVIAPTAGGGARTMRRRRYHGKRRDKRKLTARRHKK